MPHDLHAAQDGAAAPASPETSPADRAPAEAPRDPLLTALGERVRTLRARRGLTRKQLAATAEVSERHLANLEYGVGNASILVLQQVAGALQSPLAELIGDVTTVTPEWLLIRELLAGRNEEQLREARLRLADLFGDAAAKPSRRHHIALIGLRGAGKSTLGRRLAEDLDWPFVELSRAVEEVAGCSITEIHSLYGANAYRRYERRALEETLQRHVQAVIATPGGLVADASNFNLLLAHCTTLWLQAEPEDHMRRVLAQGDLRPMSGHREAMDDLKRILAGRTAFYAKADLAFNTSGRSLDDAFEGLRAAVAQQLGQVDWNA